MRAYVLVFAGLAVFAASFASDAEWKSKRKRHYDCSKDLKRATAKFNNGRYNEAKTILTETRYQCNGHDAMDSILYYLGMSSLYAKAHEEARTEFERLAVDFPNSPFAEEARFRMGHCSFLASNPPHRNQSGTLDAIRDLNQFIGEYPNSPFTDSAEAYVVKCYDKLAQKEFDAGKFYQKLDKYESAIVYYRILAAEYPDCKYITESRLSTAYCLAKLQRPGEGRDVLQQLISEKPDMETVQKAENLMSRLEIIASEKPGFLFFGRRKNMNEPGSTPDIKAKQPEEAAPSKQNSTDQAIPPDSKKAEEIQPVENNQPENNPAPAVLDSLETPADSLKQ